MMNYFSIFDRTIVVDNFYRDPDAIRRIALEQQKTSESTGNYAGIMTEESFLTQEHIDVFSKLLGHRVFPSTSFTGKFRFTRTGDQYKQDIHFDPGDNSCCWAGVVYLTPTDHAADGTIFWKHKKTQLDAIPLTHDGIKKYGWSDASDLKVFLETDGVNHSLWDKTLAVPYKYNRLVMFRPWLFHSPGPAFGDTIEGSRLVQTFFWSSAEPSIV